MSVRSDAVRLGATSDGYATGLITYALEQVGVSRENVQLKRGLAWLVRNQNRPTVIGWPTLSIVDEIERLTWGAS